MFFDDYKEFVEQDIRSTRVDNFQVTSETLSRRCEVMLPKDLIENKTVLDLGSALGAMGHWCLTNGAKSYTGVEIQQKYRDTSNFILEKYHKNFQLVKTIEDISEPHDVVIAAGFLHGTFNIISLIEKVCNLSKQYVIIETVLETSPHEYIFLSPTVNMINVNNETISTYTGCTTLPTKTALNILMQINGFEIEKDNIIPNIIQTKNKYGVERFIFRYVKSNNNLIKVLESEIKNGNLEI